MSVIDIFLCFFSLVHFFRIITHRTNGIGDSVIHDRVDAHGYTVLRQDLVSIMFTSIFGANPVTNLVRRDYLIF